MLPWCRSLARSSGNGDWGRHCLRHVAGAAPGIAEPDRPRRGQPHLEHTAVAGVRDAYPALVGFDDAADDGQPEAGASVGAGCAGTDAPPREVEDRARFASARDSSRGSAWVTSGSPDPPVSRTPRARATPSILATMSLTSSPTSISSRDWCSVPDSMRD